MIPNSRQSLINSGLFIQNKYFDWYTSIVSSRVDNVPEGYSEKHHIIPKSLGKSNEPSNLVRLTAREHFVVHLLLIKCMASKNGYHKMVTAAHRLLHGNDQKYVYNSRLYEAVKVKHSEIASEKFKKWWKDLGEERKKEFVKKRNQNVIRKPCPDHVKEAVSKANTGKTPRLGIAHTEESKDKMRRAARERNRNRKWFHSVELQKSVFVQECPEGFKPGRLPGQLKGRTGSVSGMKWYHNPETKEEKYFYFGQEPEGYVQGRYPK